MDAIFGVDAAMVGQCSRHLLVSGVECHVVIALDRLTLVDSILLKMLGMKIDKAHIKLVSRPFTFRLIPIAVINHGRC